MRHRSTIRGLRALLALVAIAAIIAPLSGPVFDHHFAERQPHHLHFGTPGEHSHAFESSYHFHRHSPTTPADVGVPIVFFKSDGSIAATTSASPVDVDVSSMRQFQPSSVFILPTSLTVAARQRTPPPPDRPPAPLAQHPADFPIHSLGVA